MVMPKSLAGWCTALFFLWYGLGALLPSLGLMSGTLGIVGGILALGAAVFTFLGR